MIRLLAATAFSLLMLVSAASAALIEMDLTPGDGLVTLDDETNLEWLDLTATQGLSWNQAISTSYVTDEGFRHATRDEVQMLFENAGFVTTNNANNVLNNPAATALLDRVGCTQFCGTINATGRGFADAGGGWATRPNYHTGGLGSGAAIVSLQTMNFDLIDATAGHFLVRDAVTPIPEPSAAVLFLLGGATVAHAIRRPRS